MWAQPWTYKCRSMLGLIQNTPSQPGESTKYNSIHLKNTPSQNITVFVSSSTKSMILSMWLQCSEVEHGRNHLITGQWCEMLTSAREITIDVNDSQGTIVQYTKCEYMIWCRALSRIFWSKVNDVNLCQERENISLRHIDLKVLNLFLRLFPG